MSVTILEALMNAEHNFRSAGMFPPIKDMALTQLHNGIVLLEKGYGVYELVEPLLEQYGEVENVPECSSDEPQPAQVE